MSTILDVKNTPNPKNTREGTFQGENQENLSVFYQVVFIHPFLRFQNSFGIGKTHLRGLLECKDLIIRTLRMQKTLCDGYVVFYYKNKSKTTKIS